MDKATIDLIDGYKHKLQHERGQHNRMVIDLIRFIGEINEAAMYLLPDSDNRALILERCETCLCILNKQ